MDNNVLATILKDTYTLRDLKGKLNILKAYLEQEFFNPSLKKEFSAKDLSWLKSLPPTLLQSFNKDNLASLSEDLHKQIGALKVLTIYLSFEPDPETIAQIGQKVRANFPTISLLDIKYDPALIAGPALVSRGIYKDYSLRAKIGEKKADILSNFKKFLR